MVKSIGTIECSVVKNFLQIINTDFKILTNGVVGDPRLQKIQFLLIWNLGACLMTIYISYKNRLINLLDCGRHRLAFNLFVNC